MGYAAVNESGGAPPKSIRGADGVLREAGAEEGRVLAAGGVRSGAKVLGLEY